MTARQFETVWASRMLSVFRIMAALLFFAHETDKILAFPDTGWTPGAFTPGWIAG